MRHIATLIMVVVCLSLGSATRASEGPPLNQSGQELVDQSDWSEIKPILPKFFDALRKADGKVALESIKDKFPITSASANLLALKIDELIGSFGSFNSYDLVGIRALPRGKRLYEIAYVTWNASTPALWEGTFYKRNDGWVLMTLSFNTDGIFEKAREYR